MPIDVQTSVFQLFGDEGKQRLTFNENENTVVIAFLGDDGFYLVYLEEMYI